MKEFYWILVGCVILLSITPVSADGFQGYIDDTAPHFGIQVFPNSTNKAMESITYGTTYGPSYGWSSDGYCQTKGLHAVYIGRIFELTSNTTYQFPPWGSGQYEYKQQHEWLGGIQFNAIDKQLVEIIRCGAGPNNYTAPYWDYVPQYWYRSAGVNTLPPIVDFIGTPLDGYNPLSVNFTIYNYTAINPLTLNQWNFGDGVISNASSSTISHTYQNAGIYTVSLHYTNTSGFEETITKPNYVLASIPTGMILYLDIRNAISGAYIQDSTVGIQNTSTGVWRNSTSPTGKSYISTTDPGFLYPLSLNQTIALAANKTGYKSASDTFAIPRNHWLATLFLMPDTVTNATGAGTVVVNVIRNKDGVTVPGVSVVMDTGQIGITNSAGAATFMNVTAGARVIRVSDPDDAYEDTEKSFDLVAGETELLVIQVVLLGEMPVTTYGTPVPTPTGTYDPSDPSSPGYGNYTATQVNQQGSEGIIQMLSQLIALWPLIVLGVFMKFIKSAFT